MLELRVSVHGASYTLTITPNWGTEPLSYSAYIKGIADRDPIVMVPGLFGNRGEAIDAAVTMLETKPPAATPLPSGAYRS